MDSSLPRLGSLAQSARSKQLKTARWILIVVGVVSILANGVFFALAQEMVKKEFDKELRNLPRDTVIDQQKLRELHDQAVRVVQLMAVAGIVLGVVFVVLGGMVYKAPVAVTVLGLVIYIGNIAVTAALDPATLVQGWLIKILIIVALSKSIQAAFAYQRERQREEEFEDGELAAE